MLPETQHAVSHDEKRHEPQGRSDSFGTRPIHFEMGEEAAMLIADRDLGRHPLSPRAPHAHCTGVVQHFHAREVPGGVGRQFGQPLTQRR